MIIKKKRNEVFYDNGVCISISRSLKYSQLQICSLSRYFVYMWRGWKSSQEDAIATINIVILNARRIWEKYDKYV